MEPRGNNYNTYAKEYAKYIERLEADEAKGETDRIVEAVLHYAGDISGLEVLDAGCGEGYLTRKLVRLGAQITAIDASANLIEIARSKPKQTSIVYMVGDLSRPLKELEGKFDLIISNMVIMDVPDYEGFVDTLSSALRNLGRVVLSMHNPYNSVLQERVSNYFDSGKSKSYVGFERATGVRVKYYHRTLEEYVATFRDRGFMLRNLCDVEHAGEEAYYFPKIMVLEFQKIPIELRKAA